MPKRFNIDTDIIHQYQLLSALEANLFLRSVQNSKNDKNSRQAWYKVSQVSHMPSQADEQTAAGLDHRQAGQHGGEASGTQRPISPDVMASSSTSYGVTATKAIQVLPFVGER